MADEKIGSDVIVTKPGQGDVFAGQGTGEARATDRRWGRVWAIGGMLAALLCCMPTLITLGLVVVHALTGSALWATYEEAPDVSILALPLLVVLANWPVFVLVLTTWRLQARGSDSRVALFINCGVLLGLAVMNVPLWIGTPDEMLSNASDAGQGTGVIMALMIVGSPFVAIVGGIVGWIALSIRRNVDQHS